MKDFSRHGCWFDFQLFHSITFSGENNNYSTDEIKKLKPVKSVPKKKAKIIAVHKKLQTSLFFKCFTKSVYCSYCNRNSKNYRYCVS